MKDCTWDFDDENDALVLTDAKENEEAKAFIVIECQENEMLKVVEI